MFICEKDEYGWTTYVDERSVTYIPRPSWRFQEDFPTSVDYWAGRFGVTDE